MSPPGFFRAPRMALVASLSLLLPTTYSFVVSPTVPSSVALPFSAQPCRRETVALGSTTTTVATGGGASTLKSILKKPSKVLTVGLEYAGDDETLAPEEIDVLSMQLRKTKVAAVWCSDVGRVGRFATEQESARGDFPGPCPVIYHGPADGALAAIEAGASAVVLNPTDNAPPSTADVVWRASTPDDVTAVVDATGGAAEAFLIDLDDEWETVASSAPPGSLLVAAVDAMRPDGAEVARGRDAKPAGFASILVRGACVGDAEDLEYARFVVDGLTSKASSEFKFSGLTGSTNGHFGGVQGNESVKWRRTEDL